MFIFIVSKRCIRLPCWRWLNSPTAWTASPPPSDAGPHHGRPQMPAAPSETQTPDHIAINVNYSSIEPVSMDLSRDAQYEYTMQADTIYLYDAILRDIQRRSTILFWQQDIDTGHRTQDSGFLLMRIYVTESALILPDLFLCQQLYHNPPILHWYKVYHSALLSAQGLNIRLNKVFRTPQSGWTLSKEVLSVDPCVRAGHNR